MFVKIATRPSVGVKIMLHKTRTRRYNIIAPPPPPRVGWILSRLPESMTNNIATVNRRVKTENRYVGRKY